MNKLFKYKIYCQTEQTWHFIWLEEGKPTPTKCPVDTSHTVDIGSVSIDTIRLPDMAKVEVTSTPAFAAKTVGTKKLFKRVHGITAEVTTGVTEVNFTIPYAWVKIMALEIVNCSPLDTIDLYIMDTPTGAYSTLPNYKLNQFGFGVALCNEFYKHESEFDADLYQGMVVRVTYKSTTAKTIGVNFVMNEVK